MASSSKEIQERLANPVGCPTHTATILAQHALAAPRSIPYERYQARGSLNNTVLDTTSLERRIDEVVFRGTRSEWNIRRLTPRAAIGLSGAA